MLVLLVWAPAKQWPNSLLVELAVELRAESKGLARKLAKKLAQNGDNYD